MNASKVSIDVPVRNNEAGKLPLAVTSRVWEEMLPFPVVWKT